MTEGVSSHVHVGEPSGWVRRFSAAIRRGGTVLDVACGSGRHARWLASAGHKVEAVDRDAAALDALADAPGVRTLQADLESGDWPYEGRRFDAVVVANYLFRPAFAHVLGSVAPGGLLIYETFMVGNERFGKPSNPDFLLAPDELLHLVDDRFRVVAFEQGEVAAPKAAMVQRICAIRCDGTTVELPRID